MGSSGVQLHGGVGSGERRWRRARIVRHSVLGYYFDATTWIAIIERAALGLDPNGSIVAVHWLGHSADHARHGDDVHADLHAVLGRPDGAYRQCQFRLDWWQR